VECTPCWYVSQVDIASEKLPSIGLLEEVSVPLYPKLLAFEPIHVVQFCGIVFVSRYPLLDAASSRRNPVARFEMAKKTLIKDLNARPEQNATEGGRKSLVTEPPVYTGAGPRSCRSRGSKRPISENSVSTLLHSSRRNSYAPVVSSPLKTDGNSSEGSEGSEGSDIRPQEPPLMRSARLAPRRSLHIQVVDASTLPKILDEKSGDYVGHDGPSQPSSSSNPSPSVSLQSIGRGFSRYSSRHPSESLIGSSTPPRIPMGTHFNDTFTSLGQAFDTVDPERGFSPYVKQRSVPIVYPTIDELEDDDSLHNPDTNGDVAPSLRECCSHCSPRFLLTFMCFILLMIGPAILFIVWPILSYSRIGRQGDSESELSSYSYPILGAVRTTLIDPDTPDYAMIRESVLGQGKLKLVFSDEFNQEGRSFYENDDQFWQAADFHYAATNDLEWYDPDAVTTQGGTLQIRMDALPSHNLDYRSGMLQSWNKICFKGGVMEVSASLAGPAGVPGLWPGIWTLGNLARPGYRATSDGVWPYSYDNCDVGITPNQSSSDGISFLPGQKLAKCVCSGEEHPTPGRGRGAPEIDALEGTAEYNMRVGVVTQSSQVVRLTKEYL